MSHRRPWSAPLTLAVLAALTACTASNAVGPREEVLVLEVAPERAPCVGEMTGSCLQVRAPGEEAWELFYDSIEGFDFEVGVAWTLEVLRTEVDDPPADASRYRYQLLRVLSRDPAGTP